MAEERLIDRDKDKKYIIKKNENGEDELVIDDGLSEQEEQSEQMSFEVPDFDEGEQKSSVLTDEQIAERQRKQDEENAELAAKKAAYIAAANADMDLGNFATALENIIKAEDIDKPTGQTACLKMRIYTRNFTSYEKLAEAEECSEEVEELASIEQKQELFAMGEKSLSGNISRLNATVSDLNEKNEQAKAQRAVGFKAALKKAGIILAAVAVPFAAFVALFAVFFTLRYTLQNGTYLVLAIIFGALSGVSVLALIYAAYRFARAAKYVSLNKRNTTSKLGRQYLEELGKLNAFKRIYSVLNTQN